MIKIDKNFLEYPETIVVTIRVPISGSDVETTTLVEIPKTLLRALLVAEQKVDQ